MRPSQGISPFLPSPLYMLSFALREERQLTPSLAPSPLEPSRNWARSLMLISLSLSLCFAACILHRGADRFVLFMGAAARSPATVPHRPIRRSLACGPCMEPWLHRDRPLYKCACGFLRQPAIGGDSANEGLNMHGPAPGPSARGRLSMPSEHPANGSPRFNLSPSPLHAPAPGEAFASQEMQPQLMLAP
jgi:hypothetical protein